MTFGGPGCHTHSYGRSSLNQCSSPHLFAEYRQGFPAYVACLSPSESLRNVGTHALSGLYWRALECGKEKPEMYQRKNSFCGSRRMFCQWEVIRGKQGNINRVSWLSWYMGRYVDKYLGKNLEDTRSVLLFSKAQLMALLVTTEY